MNRPWLALAVTALVVTAGCAGGQAVGTSGDGAGPGDGANLASADGAGTVSFYVSDRPNDIDDFEHLNVTVSSVAFHLADPADEAGNGTDVATDTETDAETGTDTDTETDPGTATDTESSTDTETDAESATDTETDVITAVEQDAGSDASGENETMSGTDVDADDESEMEEEDESEMEDEDEMDDADDVDGDGTWVTRETNATVDLTDLRGDNATFLQAFELPAGEYDQVVLSVSDVDATLTTGESANVKLPSGKLKLNEEFTVANGSDVEFVYDVSVHKAGNSGKYILKPVVSESGTDVPIDPVESGDGDATEADDEDEREMEDENESEMEDEDEREMEDENESEMEDGEATADDAAGERPLQVSVVGPLRPGETVTLVVTDGEGPVANATVEVDDGGAGQTNADGEVAVALPAADDDGSVEVEVEVEAGDAEAEFEWSVANATAGANATDVPA